MTPPLSRRNFLKLAALSGGSLALEGAFVVSGNPERGIDYFAAVSRNWESGKNIIQTGIDSLEINGQKFRVEIDKDIFTAMILHQAGIQNDSVFVNRTREWLGQNELEVEIYDFQNNPFLYYLAEGYFLAPEFHLGRAKIGIPVHQIENLYHRKREEKREEGQIDPVFIIPHELNHLLDYIKSPRAYLARAAARVGEVIVSAVTAKAAGDQAKEEEVGVGKIFLRQMGTFGSMMLAFHLFNTILGIDQHSNVTESEVLTKQISEDPKFRELALGVVKFTLLD